MYCPNSYCTEVPGVYQLNALCKLLVRIIHGVSEVKPMRLPHLLSLGLFMTSFRYKVCTIHSCFPLAFVGYEWGWGRSCGAGCCFVCVVCEPSKQLSMSQLLAHSHSCRGKPEEQKGEKLIIG